MNFWKGRGHHIEEYERTQEKSSVLTQCRESNQSVNDQLWNTQDSESQPGSEEHHSEEDNTLFQASSGGSVDISIGKGRMAGLKIAP